MRVGPCTRSHRASPWFIASWLPLILLDAAQTALSTVIAEQRG
jgi:hypothetical protein